MAERCVAIVLQIEGEGQKFIKNLMIYTLKRALKAATISLRLISSALCMVWLWMVIYSVINYCLHPKLIIKDCNILDH